MEVVAERHGSADDGAEVEDGPEDTDETALLSFRWIGEHEGALGGPQEGGAYAEEGACDGDEVARARMDVDGAM